MKKHLRQYIISLCLILLVSFIFLVPLVIDAQRAYTPLETIPGLTDQKSFSKNAEGDVDLGTFISSAYTFLISIAAVFAVFMITVGGFQYVMSAANVGGKEQGKERIMNSIYGLLLIIFSWVIIYTINPQALNFNVFFGNPGDTGGNGTASESSVWAYKYANVEQLYSTYPTLNEAAFVSSGTFSSSQTCNDSKATLDKLTYPKYEPRYECRPDTLQEGQMAYSYTYNTYTSPSDLYLAEKDQLANRTIETKTYTDADPQRCESQRQQMANRKVKTYFPTNDTCQGGNIKPYLEYSYLDQNSKLYRLTFNSRTSCQATLDSLITLAEGVASISPKCTETYVRDALLTGATRTIYCNDLILTSSGQRDAGAESCYTTKEECVPTQLEFNKQRRPFYETQSCLEQ